MEEILKESLLMKVRDNASLARRLDVQDKDHDLDYTEDEDYENKKSSYRE